MASYGRRLEPPIARQRRGGGYLLGVGVGAAGARGEGAGGEGGDRGGTEPAGGFGGVGRGVVDLDDGEGVVGRVPREGGGEA